MGRTRTEPDRVCRRPNSSCYATISNLEAMIVESVEPFRGLDFNRIPEETDDKGKRIRAAKYPGIHALRHFYASWCINRKEDGELGLPSKIVQERMGHSTITMTMDICGHLFPRGNDAEEMAAAVRSLLA
jgi:integrase